MQIRTSPMSSALAGLGAGAARTDRAARELVSAFSPEDRVTLSDDARAASPEAAAVELVEGTLLYKVSGGVVSRVREAEQTLLDLL